jgi:hypothetical protein
MRELRIYTGLPGREKKLERWVATAVVLAGLYAVVQAREATWVGGPVRQPYAGVDFTQS